MSDTNNVEVTTPSVDESTATAPQYCPVCGGECGKEEDCSGDEFCTRINDYVNGSKGGDTTDKIDSYNGERNRLSYNIILNPEYPDLGVKKVGFVTDEVSILLGSEMSLVLKTLAETGEPSIDILPKVTYVVTESTPEVLGNPVVGINNAKSKLYALNLGKATIVGSTGVLNESGEDIQAEIKVTVVESFDAPEGNGGATIEGN